jgi:hypothetical protein
MVAGWTPAQQVGSWQANMQAGLLTSAKQSSVGSCLTRNHTSPTLNWLVERITSALLLLLLLLPSVPAAGTKASSRRC